MDNENLDQNIDSQVKVTSEENIDKPTVENTVTEEDKVNEAKREHSKKLNNFLNKFEATSLDMVIEQFESLKANNEELSNNKNEWESKYNETVNEFNKYKDNQFYSSFGLEDSQLDDFKNLLNQRTNANPETSRDEIAADLMDKYFKPKTSFKIGTEKSNEEPKLESEEETYLRKKREREDKYRVY